MGCLVRSTTSSPGVQLRRSGLLFCLVVIHLAGCDKSPGVGQGKFVYGAMRIKGTTVSAAERSRMLAEANGFQLLQLCNGDLFEVVVKDDGAVDATLQSSSEIAGVVAKEVAGAKGYAFVKLDMPASAQMPNEYKSSSPAVIKIHGDADKVIPMIASQVSEYGKGVLKAKNAFRALLYVQVTSLKFRIDEAPPLFSLELQIRQSN